MPWKTTDTKLRLMDAAREEFLHYGFKGASLHRIASSVGIAAPSVYNHFSGKEALFSALVEPCIQKISQTFHAVDSNKQKLMNARQSADLILDRAPILQTVLEFVFNNLEDVKLLLFCASGTKYENILDQAAHMEAEATCQMMENAGFPPFSEEEKETIYLLMKHQYQTYAEAIRLQFSKERTKDYWNQVSTFCTEGWKRLLKL